MVQATLPLHRPVGCVVEESLAPPAGTVFVASVKPGGHADRAGVAPGDVIVGVTGIFGALEDVTGLGIDKVYVWTESTRAARDDPFVARNKVV